MTSTIERVEEEIRIPYDEPAIRSGNPVQLANYILSLVKVLQRLLEDHSQAINLTVDSFDGEALYLATKNPDGTYPIGTWRFIQVGNNLERQVQLTLGVWTFAGDFERPI